MTIESPQTELDPKAEQARLRYEAAAKALADAGALSFVELVEARDPVAMEYLLALEEYGQITGADSLSHEPVKSE